MKQYNCPDCDRLDSCEDCPRTISDISNVVIEHIPPYFPDSVIWSKDTYIPACCRNCSNHPSNGGSGFCNCTAPLYDPSSPLKVTYSTDAKCIITY